MATFGISISWFSWLFPIWITIDVHHRLSLSPSYPSACQCQYTIVTSWDSMNSIRWMKFVFVFHFIIQVGLLLLCQSEIEHSNWVENECERKHIRKIALPLLLLPSAYKLCTLNVTTNKISYIFSVQIGTMLLCRSITIFCVDFVCTNGFIMKYKSKSLVERAIWLNQKG